jgi:hypothetical protein
MYGFHFAEFVFSDSAAIIPVSLATPRLPLNQCSF